MELSPTVNLTLEDVQSHFEQWRATRTKRTKIPESLWQEVMGIAKHYRHTKTIQALHLNSSQLKSKTQYCNHNFIKLESPAPATNALTFESTNCVIQLYHPKGSHMNICIQQQAFLKEIITAFLQA